MDTDLTGTENDFCGGSVTYRMERQVEVRTGTLIFANPISGYQRRLAFPFSLRWGSQKLKCCANRTNYRWLSYARTGGERTRQGPERSGGASRRRVPELRLDRSLERPLYEGPRP